MRLVTVAAALCGFLLVASAAAGAHLVSSTADAVGGSAVGVEEAEDIRIAWERAVTFGLLHVAPLLVAALALPRSRLAQGSAMAFLAGIVLFSGVQLLRLALEAMELSGGAVTAGTGEPVRPLAMIGWLVPVGGISLHLGWLLLAGALLWRKPADS